MKERAIGNTLAYKGVLTKQGTYIIAILGTGILNNCRMDVASASSHYSDPDVDS